MGVGKTTVSRRLSRVLGAKCISIDYELDRMGLDYIDETIDQVPERNYMLTIDDLIPKVRKMLQAGQVVIFDGCLYHKSVIEQIEKELRFPHLVLTLEAPVEKCIARDRGRETSYGEEAARTVYKLVTAFRAGTAVDASGGEKATVGRIMDMIHSNLLAQ